MLFFSFGNICLILAIIINYSTNNMKYFFTFDGICLSRIACCLFLALAMGNAHAQKIDFDTSTTNPNPTSDGFTSWCPGEISSGNTAQSTFTGVTVTISHGSGTTGNLIKENRWKDGTNSGDEERKLISDGIYSTNSGSHVSGGKVAITITVKGLSAGTHTLQAYHNNVDFTDGQYSLAPIYVSVGGTDVVSGIAQTARATTLASCAKTYVSFNVASSSTEVAITYYTKASSSYDYNDFYINSLEFDQTSLDNQATAPSPANLDWHVETSTGNATLSWTASANSPSKHTVYFGENESGMTQLYSGTATSCQATGLSPLKRYYWRVDETIDGTTYPGEVWTFQPRRLAFPGAEGYGKYAVGGRGGVVYHVTSLADDGSNGTLRYGIESLTGPRTIVFDVAGTIQLNSRLTCSDDFVTIAGQTAPGIGVQLRDYDFAANSNDGITRFLRFRYGHGDDWNGTSANQNTGNAAGLIADYGIMDHCMLGWGSDEVFSSRGAKHITLQHSLIGEALNQNGHKNYYDSDHSVKHGYAATVGGEIASLHHNLLAHNEGRNWSLGGGLDNNNTFAGRLNIYNNVVYNWGHRATDGGAHQVNFVGNYYKKGPATSQNYIFTANHEDNFAGTQEYYLNGNLRVSQDGNIKTADKEGDTYTQTISSGITVNWTTFVSSPYDFYSMDQGNVESAEAAFLNVLSDVGCNYAGLDNNEQRLVRESRDGTATKTGSRSGLQGLIEKESDSEGWDGLGIVTESRDSSWDTDNDGIPDWFETAKGWSTSAANNNDCSDNTNYYTNLEEYLNWMACPHFYNLTKDQAITIDLTTYFAGYTSPSFTIGSATGLSTSLSGTTLTVTPSAEGLASITIKATQGGISLTRIFNFHTAGEASQTVTVEGNATYLVKAGDTFTSGQTIEVNTDDGVVATITYGVEGGAAFGEATANASIEGFEAFTGGNGVNGSATGGTLYIINPVYDGTIEVAVVLNANKAFYVLEDGTAMEGYDGMKETSKVYATYSFPVKGGSEYKVYCTGSKLGFFGFNYSYSYTTGGDEPIETSHTWNFTNWEIASYSEQTTIDGLTLEASSSKGISIANDNAGGDYGAYTKALKFSGTGNASQNCVHFEVPGKCKITIVAKHSSSTQAEARPLVVSKGSFGTNAESIPVEWGAADTYTYAYLEDSPTTIYVYSGKSNLKLYVIEFETITDDDYVQLTLNKYGYSTFHYSNHNYVIPYGVTATIVPEVTKRQMVLTELSKEIPAASSVILEGTPNTTYTFVASGNEENAVTENMLMGSDEPQYTVGPDDEQDYVFYMLSAKNGRVGFYYGANDGAAFLNGAHKAYLAVPTSVADGINAFYFDNTDEIKFVADDMANKSDTPAYNLAGQRVGSAYKGVVVVNGKKSIRK